MHLQSLKLLCPTVWEEMHLQENTFLDLGVKATQNIAQYPLHHVTYAPAKFEVDISNGLGRDSFIRNMTHGCMHTHRHTQTDGLIKWTDVAECSKYRKKKKDTQLSFVYHPNRNEMRRMVHNHITCKCILIIMSSDGYHEYN